MLPRARWRVFKSAFENPLLPLHPLSTTQSVRTFSVCPQCLSKIGSAPLSIPAGVTFEVLPPKESYGLLSASQPSAKRLTARERKSLKIHKIPREAMGTVHIKGPLGEMALTVPPYLSFQRQETESGQQQQEHQGEAQQQQGRVVVSVQDSRIRVQREMWGNVRARLANNLLGVSEGHTAVLRLVGVGYRATVEPTAATVAPEFAGQTFVNLKVGYSHPIELPVPRGVTATCPQPTRILLEGVDKEAVRQFAANIRKWRVPEPYKGKGIFVDGETIKLKNKKIK